MHPFDYPAVPHVQARHDPDWLSHGFVPSSNHMDMAAK
jgi:hypothetical protein